MEVYAIHRPFGEMAPEEFTGLSVRYSDTTAVNGDNVLLAGGAGADNASIWLVAWGEEAAGWRDDRGVR